ncbi:MAG: spermidine/putrescine ABC transporter substrate-binding protein [Deltaproteobacteria bacterium]|nr:spermidine/putrescine ABC transporter substrate-binding protein [Deltaproteobacteria bacterium]
MQSYSKLARPTYHVTASLLLALLTVSCTIFKKRPDSHMGKLRTTEDEAVLNLYIWADYTSPAMIEDFTRASGIKIRESNYASNEELLAKLQSGATGYDLIVPSDYMVSTMIKLNLLQQLDRRRITRLDQIDPRFLGRSYDPANTWSVPFAWAVSGIAVNTRAYKDPVTSWNDLLRNQKVKGRVSLMDDVREALAVALKIDGHSVNTQNRDELNQAKTTLITAKQNLKAFNAFPSTLITTGEVVMAHMYSGETMVAARDSGKALQFVIPKEGSIIAIDNMVIPKGAKHVDAAYAFINYFYQPRVNADFVQRMYYGPVVKGAAAFLPLELKQHPVLFPTESTIKNCEMLRDLGDTTTIYDRIWLEVKVSG